MQVDRVVAYCEYTNTSGKDRTEFFGTNFDIHFNVYFEHLLRYCEYIEKLNVSIKCSLNVFLKYSCIR